MTRANIEELAQTLPRNERWERLSQCGAHDWQSLPIIDSGEHFCPACSTVWDFSGRILNLPSPRELRG